MEIEVRWIYKLRVRIQAAGNVGIRYGRAISPKQVIAALDEIAGIEARSPAAFHVPIWLILLCGLLNDIVPYPNF
jgi:hypothetical protein